MSIRLRVTMVFTVALGVALALGIWLFLSQLNAQLLATTDATLQAQLGGISRTIPAGSGPAQARQLPRPENFLIQVISPAGKVIRYSSEAGAAPMLPTRVLDQARHGSLSTTVTVDDERVRAFAEPAGRRGWVAVAGVSLEDYVGRTQTKETTTLVLAGLVFVLLGGIGAYWLARAALSPVERMRREVAALSERDTQGGVRVPKTRDELAALAGTMNDLLARLQDALARQRGFVADASHELRTPLAVLGAELELAGRPGRSRDELAAAAASAAAAARAGRPGRSRDELAAAAASAEAEVARLTRITNDLLVLARSDEGRLPVRPEPTDVAVLLDRSAAAATVRAREAGVDCAANAPPGLVALIDPDRIRQAVDNLIDNALRFAPRGSQVTVGARPAGDALVIEVVDGGPGFSADFLPHAFERFRRPDTGRARSQGGAGLGLAIVAAIAAAHGGTATATNRPGGGAVVTVDLPGAIAKPGAVKLPAG